MARGFWAGLAVAIVALGSAGRADAGRLVYMGPDPSCHNTSEQTQQAINIVSWAGNASDPRILLVEANCGSAAETMLSNAGFTHVTPIDQSNFASQTLSNFDVIYVTYSSDPSNFTSSASAVRAFVNAGGGLVIEGNSNSIAWAPFGNQVGYNADGDDVDSIVNPSHPIMMGLTVDGFSNSHSTFGNALPAGFEILARDENGDSPDFIVFEGVVSSSSAPTLSWPGMAALALVLVAVGRNRLQRV